MTDTETATLIARIKHTWRGGAHPDIWREVLVDLDAGTAGTTIVRLARDLDDAPSIAAFLRAYRSLDTPANDPATWTPPTPRCGHCRTELDRRSHRPLGRGCPECRIPDPATGWAIAQREIARGRADLYKISDGRLGEPGEPEPEQPRLDEQF